MARFRPSQGLVPNARRALRDSLLPLLRQPGFVVGVLASDESAQMKPQVAAELALAIASSAQFRLLLVDCDFQAPSLTPLLRVDVPLSAGFSLQLQTHSREAEDVGWSVVRCTPSLDLLAESALRAPDALRGQEFEHCIASIRRNYDIVILNGALLSRFDECQAIAAVSDAVVAVSRRDPQSLVQDIAQRLASRIPIRVEPA
jgi:Mrp family chromosome partitioning ATPase